MPPDSITKQKQLGQGGFAVVHRAELRVNAADGKTTTTRQVAVKSIKDAKVFAAERQQLVTLFGRVRPAHLARVAAEASRRIGTADPPGLAVAKANGPLRR